MRRGLKGIFKKTLRAFPLFIVLVFTNFAFKVQGETIAQFSRSFYRGDSFWNKKGKKLSAFNRYEKQEFELALIKTFSKNFVSLNISYADVNESVNGNSRGWGDIEASWRHPFIQRKLWSLEGEAIAIVPSGKRKAEIRYGKGGIEGRLYCVRRNFWPYRKSLAQAWIGYRFYSGFPSDQARLGISGIYPALLNRLYLETALWTEYGLFNGRREAQNIFFNNANYRLIAGKGMVIWRFAPSMSMQMGYIRHLWGENIGTGGRFLAAVSLAY